MKTIRVSAALERKMRGAATAGDALEVLESLVILLDAAGQKQDAAREKGGAVAPFLAAIQAAGGDLLLPNHLGAPAVYSSLSRAMGKLGVTTEDGRKIGAYLRVAQGQGAFWRDLTVERLTKSLSELLTRARASTSQTSRPNPQIWEDE